MKINMRESFKEFLCLCEEVSIWEELDKYLSTLLCSLHPYLVIETFNGKPNWFNSIRIKEIWQLATSGLSILLCLSTTVESHWVRLLKYENMFSSDDE